MMKNIFYLRRINLIGASTFAIYGLLVGAIPVFILNAFISIVDIYYIIEPKKKKEYFTLLQIENSTEPLLNKFYKFYKDDIKKFFPKFNILNIDEDKSFFILRNLIPVGLFTYKVIDDKTVFIDLDYAIPDYRDLKNARFIYFAESNHFIKNGYKFLLTETEVLEHKKYLRKIGFKESSKKTSLFEKVI